MARRKGFRRLAAIVGRGLHRTAVQLGAEPAPEDMAERLRKLAEVDTAVTAENTTRAPAVVGAVQFVQGTLSSAPIRIGGAETDDLEAQRLEAVLNGRWTRTEHSVQARQRLISILMRRGEAHVVLGRNEQGRARSLDVLPPHSLQPAVDGYCMAWERERAWRSTGVVKGLPADVDAEDVVYIPLLPADADPLRPGLVLTKHGDAMLKVQLRVLQWLRKFFKSLNAGAYFMEAIGDDPKQWKRQLELLERSARNMMDGDVGIMMVAPGSNPRAITTNNRQSQVVQIAIEGVRNVARFFGLPPSVLADPGVGAPTDATARYVAGISLVRYASSIAGALTLRLFPRPEDPRHVKFDLSGVTRGPLAERLEAYGKAIQTGQLTPEEARSAEGRAQPEDPDSAAAARKLYVQGATVELGGADSREDR